MARRKGEPNSKDNRSRRLRAYEKQGGVCWLCDKPLTLKEATLDHVFPWSIGGSSSMDNIRIAHEKCNNKRQAFGLSKEELWYWAWVSYERGWRKSPPKCPKPTLKRFENGKPILSYVNDKDGTTEVQASLSSINLTTDVGQPRNILS
jgi:hypothetical protein